MYDKLLKIRKLRAELAEAEKADTGEYEFSGQEYVMKLAVKEAREALAEAENEVFAYCRCGK